MGSILPSRILPVCGMVDTIHLNVSSIPLRCPKVAGYVTGTPEIIWTQGDWNRFRGAKITVNQQNNSDPLLGNVLDIEPGAWTIPAAAEACITRKAHGRECNLYLSQGEITASDPSGENITALVNALLSKGIKGANLCVANYNLSESQAAAMVSAASGPFPIVWVQWASPGSNPFTILPGSDMTLAEANCDLSVTAASWP
jgi:hypothetical protein